MLHKFLIILIFTLVSCQKVDLQTNKKFHQAVKLYDEENYQKASQIFREISKILFVNSAWKELPEAPFG